MLLICTILMLVTAYPVILWLVGKPSLSRLLTVELWFSFIYGSYNGAMVVFLTEIMPVSVRTTGFALAYSLATAIFGGFTPAVCTYLIHVTGNQAVPGMWLSFAAACGLVATFLRAFHVRSIPFLLKKRRVLLDHRRALRASHMGPRARDGERRAL